MEPTTRRRVLIVANRTAATPHLLDEVRRRAKEGPCDFALLIPDAGSRQAADWTLDRAIPLLRRSAGAPVEGIAGTAADPFDAVAEAVRERGFDEIIVSTLPSRTSRWLRRDLPRRVERLGLPVTLVSGPGTPGVSKEDATLSLISGLPSRGDRRS